MVAALVAVRDPLYGSCTPKREATGFLRDFVQPIIGEDVSALTEQRFGFGALWNSCEG